jgi:hypothetical protein
MQRNGFIGLSVGVDLSNRLFAILSVIFILFSSVAGSDIVEWSAYNDCIGTSSNPNTTDFSNYRDYYGVTSGPLKNDATGSTTGMPMVTFTIPPDPSIQPRIKHDYGSIPDVGTDAYDVFNGNVDFSGTVIEHSDSVGWFVEIKFSNLDPQKRYTFVGSAFRNKEYTDRITQCTILGADAYTNNSSDGVYFKSGDVTKFLPCDNSDTGHVVRWDAIDPGADGAFTVYTEAAPESEDGRLGNPLNGFMLRQIDDSTNTPPVVDAGRNRILNHPKEYLTLTGSVSDDGRGNPDGTLMSTWSQLSGPAGVEFVTDVQQPEATVRFAAPGVYELQLSATDGELSASDEVTVVAADPVCPVGDIDGDCRVTLSDFELLALNWLDDTAALADLDGDAWVTINELSLVGRSWMEDWTGSLQVTLSPAEAVAAGAQWRVNGGPWQASGATVTSLPEGAHEIDYSVVANWSAPGTKTVHIVRGQTTAAAGEYSDDPKTIVISELMATNTYLPFVSPLKIFTWYNWSIGENAYPDWIELRNISSESVNLAGWYLTDDPDNKTLWQFPSTLDSALILEPGGHLIVFTSKKEEYVYPDNYPFVDFCGALHTNFNLSASGEYLAVVAPDGETVSHEYDMYPPQYPFVSYGIADDGTIGYLLEPTPGTRVNFRWTGAANSAAYAGKVGDTQFSHHRGFFDAPFDVTISCDTDGAVIHYTLDGTEPEPTVGGYTRLYNGPIPIAATTCLRAKAFKTGMLPSNIDTQTYLFLDDVVVQTKPVDSRYAASWGGYPGDYAMENNATDLKLVAGNSAYTDQQAKAVIQDALEQIPTLSVVTDPGGLFGSTTGIYTHTLDSGELWERPVSAEYFGADVNESFQIDCGLRIQGGASRNPASEPKHSLSLRFRGGYGNAALTAGLFKQTAVEEFNTLQLRSTYNNSWTHHDSAQRNRGLMIRDQFVRDCLIAMGQQSAGDGRFVHLYLNGLYWGIYNLHERQEASHYAAYYGGEGDYYDALNGGEAVDGTGVKWNQMQSTVANASPSSKANWEAITAVLDVENYIDWTIIQRYAYNQDLKSDGNWRAAGGGAASGLWRFYAWDAERTIENGSVGTPGPQSDLSSPFLLGYLRNFQEFRVRFADRVYKHFRNQGALTYALASARFNSRVTELSDAIIAESARWGDYRRDVHVSGTAYLYTKNSFWLPEVAAFDGYLLSKQTNAVNHFKSLSPALYPSFEPPVFRIDSVEQSGGDISLPCTLTMVNPNGVGTMYYTLDGTDPREYWTNNISPTAMVSTGSPVTLTKSARVKARVKYGTTWSALHEAVYTDEQLLNALRVTELMYHPVDADGDLEFIELKNIGQTTINLDGVQFTNGIQHTFGDTAVLPGGFVLLVKDKLLFETTCPDLPAGAPVIQWTDGGLSNSGERITLSDMLGRTLLSFSYKDTWYPLTDGEGFSLTVVDPQADVSLWEQKAGWRPSTTFGGSPGLDEVGLAPGSILINELLAHSDASPDWIELINTTAQPIDLGGWFLSDDDDSLTSYQIPESTVIAAGGYLVFDEDLHFGTAFALSENGETVYLTSGAGGQITGFQVSQEFDGSDRNVSLGRHITSTGNADFVAMSAPTPGAANAYPQVGPVVVSQLHYNPGPSDTGNEYIELHNISAQRVYLEDLAKRETAPGVFVHEIVSWAFTTGIDFTFPSGTFIDAGGRLIIAKDPAALNAFYTALPAGTSVLGPYEGNLSNGGEKVRLCKPGEHVFGKDRAWIRVDQVNYDDESPWPVEADGNGPSLHRLNQSAYGNDPANWTAAAPTPGQ